MILISKMGLGGREEMGNAKINSYVWEFKRQLKKIYIYIFIIIVEYITPSSHLIPPISDI
jgi:hypothetical protein